MSELKWKLDKGLISVEDGVLDLKWSSIRLELGDDEYLQYLGVVRVIKGDVYNPLGLVIPNAYSLNYYFSERIVLHDIVEKLSLIVRTERELVVSQYIPSIYFSSSANQLEVIDVRCGKLEMYNTLFNRYLSNNGIERISENYYLLKMGVCLN